MPDDAASPAYIEAGSGGTHIQGGSMRLTTYAGSRLVAASALALGVMAVTPTTASASHNCVSWSEFTAIRGRHYGMVRDDVTRIFDVRGNVYRRSGPSHRHDIWVNYDTCERHTSYVVIHFDNYREPRHDRRMRLWHKAWRYA